MDQTISATILVADDDSVTREVLVELLGRYGYQIIVASNGTQAYEQAQRHQPDLLLLDAMMPGMTGFEVCQRLRAHPSLSELPIVMISALDDRDSRLEALRLGVDDIISKPFNAVELQLRVRTIVRLNRYRRLWEERQGRERAEEALRLRDRELAALETLLLSTALATVDELEGLAQAAARLLSTVLELPKISIVLYRSTTDQHPILAGSAPEDDDRAIAAFQSAQGAHGQISYSRTADAALAPSSKKLIRGVANALNHALERAMLSKQVSELVANLEGLVHSRTTELESERDRTRAILDAIGEAVIVTDVQGRVQYANPFALQLYGRSAPELIGSAWDLLLPQDATDQIAEARAAALRGEIWNNTVVARRRDGSAYDAAITIAPLHTADSDRRLHGFVSVQRDVTAIRAAERLKEQFIANVSHELRTPLSVIALHSGNLDTLYPTLNDAQRRQLVREIRNQARHLNDLIGSVLELIRTGRPVPTTREAIDLGDLIADVVQQQSALAHAKQITLATELDQIALVHGSIEQLRQICGNLINNAIKYTPPGRLIHVALFAPVYDQRGVACAHVSIQDTGIGIAAEHLPHLFDRFYRANPESNIPGIGLGLAIAKELVQAHGGTLSAESQLGVGSTFNLYLPLMIDEDHHVCSA